jgi:hypothetical protein
MRAAGRSKLFHAIVGIGLAAAGCGGRETTEGHAEDAQSEVAQGSSSSGEAGVDAPDDATADQGVGFTFALPDAAMDAAADVARDVAAEAWHPIPIA